MRERIRPLAMGDETLWLNGFALKQGVCCGISLVTSSLSGMRSNQLSYSPESDSGTQILLALTVTLNRAHNYFFFQHSHANTTHKIGDQVENGGGKHPQGRGQHHTEKSQNHDIDK